MAKHKQSRGLGAPDSVHLESARHLVNAAWTTLERMPPTCEGGVTMAATVLGETRAAQSHLDSIEDRATRAANTELFGLANIASKAANDTVRFFAQTCVAPHREAAERPLFSRAKALEMMRPKRKRKRSR